MEAGSWGAVARAWGLALVALGIWFVCNWAGQPHTQNYAAKSATEFSALRADATLGRILGPKEIPDPVSSPNNAAVRARIQKEFAALGVPTHTYTAFTCNAWRGFSFVACATVTDIIAEVTPGQGKAIVMLAHYDSVPAGPGASDDKSGVVTILETVRAMKARGDKSLHPVIAVITDGEEAGLLGANAFLQNAALKARVGVVVNMEARGTRGPSLLFQTSPGDGKLIDLYAKSVPVMATSSLYAEIYKFLPNDTDLTLFIDDGFPSFNFAFADNVRYYHSPMDVRANLSHATLQMHGDNLLGVVGALEHTDYAALKGGNDVYISVLGAMLPRLPESLALPFALLIFIVIAAASWMARREPFSFRAALLATVMPLALLIGCVAVGFILAAIAQAISGRPDPTYAYPINMRLALGFGLFAVTVLASRMTTLRGAAASAWLWIAGFGVLAAAFLPGISPYFTFPAFIAAILLLATSRTKAGWSGGLGQTALFVSSLGALIVWIGLVSSGETLMGLGLHELFTVPAAFGLMTLAPLLCADPMAKGAARISTTIFAVLALACAVAMGFQPAYSKESPQRVDLIYLENGSAPARWIADTSWKAKSTEMPPGALVKATGLKRIDDAFEGLFPGDAYAVDAGAPRYPLPTVNVLGDVSRDGARKLTLALHGSADASVMLLRIPSEVHLQAIDLRGQHLVVPAGWSGSTELACVSRDCRDAQMTLTLADHNPGDYVFGEERYGLPSFGAPINAARPDTAMPSQSGDAVMLANHARF